jgi:hypothetical protein
MRQSPAEAIDEWAALYATLPPLLGEGEKTLPMIARDLQIDRDTAEKLVTGWIADGKVSEVGIRRTGNSRPVMAYKIQEA